MEEEGKLEGSVPLEHLITCIPGITIVTAQNGFKVIKWIHNKPPPPNAGTHVYIWESDMRSSICLIRIALLLSQNINWGIGALSGNMPFDVMVINDCPLVMFK